MTRLDAQVETIKVEAFDRGQRARLSNLWRGRATDS